MVLNSVFTVKSPRLRCTRGQWNQNGSGWAQVSVFFKTSPRDSDVQSRFRNTIFESLSTERKFLVPPPNLASRYTWVIKIILNRWGKRIESPVFPMAATCILSNRSIKYDQLSKRKNKKFVSYFFWWFCFTGSVSISPLDSSHRDQFSVPKTHQAFPASGLFHLLFIEPSMPFLHLFPSANKKSASWLC